MQNFTNLENLQNATVYGTDGDKIGSVGQVYLDDQTGQPTFVTVRTGLFGLKETFIPVSEATSTNDGLQVPFDKAFVKDAPNIDADASLTPEEERRIYDYYSLDYRGTAGGTGRGVAGDTATTGTGYDTGRDAEVDAGLATSGGAGGRGVQGGAGYDTAGDLDRDTVGREAGTERDTESVVARNEQLDVGTEVREAGQVRLRKHTYTDTESVEVPVTREEIVVEREPVDPDSAEARAGTSDEEVVVTAREEVPVVDKTATAEKVTVDKNTVQDTETVAGTVQRENIEVEGEEGTTGHRR
jgi:uncharacterized protein (TIGR02271 family)